MNNTFTTDHERFYLIAVDSVICEYADRVDVIVNSPSEMQLPVDQGIRAAHAKAEGIAEKCGYTAYCADAHRLVLCVNNCNYVLSWNNDESPRLLESVICLDTLNVMRPRLAFPELWERLGRSAQEVG